MTASGDAGPDGRVEVMSQRSARELVAIILAAKRAAHRTRRQFVIDSGKLIDFCKIPPAGAEGVIRELERMISKQAAAETDCIAKLTGVPHAEG